MWYKSILIFWCISIIMCNFKCFYIVNTPYNSAVLLQIGSNKIELNWPVSHSARHQRPARERQKIRIASRENVDNQTPRNTNFTH